MEHPAIRIESTFPARRGLQATSLRTRADDVLIAIAVLGLVATIADGEADIREIDTFTRHFRKRFALSKGQSLKLIGLALRRVTMTNGTEMIDCACETLNEHLDCSQKTGLFDALSDVLVADGQIHESEEYFLGFIAGKLNLLSALEKRYPMV